MIKTFKNWLNRRLAWHRIWRQIQELSWITKGGRANPATRHLARFKSLEAWVSSAEDAYRRGDMEEAFQSLDMAMQSLDSMSEEHRGLLFQESARVRQEEYFLRVADLCQ